VEGRVRRRSKRGKRGNWVSWEVVSSTVGVEERRAEKGKGRGGGVKRGERETGGNWVGEVGRGGKWGRRSQNGGCYTGVGRMGRERGCGKVVVSGGEEERKGRGEDRKGEGK